MALPQYLTEQPHDLVEAWLVDFKGTGRGRPPLHKIEGVMIDPIDQVMRTTIWYWTGQHLRRVTVVHFAGTDWQEPAARALEADFQNWMSKS
jgi:hypothetical protein